MKMDDLVQLVGDNLFAHRLRALLTVLGITIGIAAVIAVVAIGQGSQAVILSELETLGNSNAFQITVDTSQGEAPTVDTFRLEDADLIKELSPAVVEMAPISYSSMVDLRLPQSLDKPLMSQLVGTTPDYAPAGNLTPQSGRFLSTADVSAHARVVVLDADLAKTDVWGLRPDWQTGIHPGQPGNSDRGAARANLTPGRDEPALRLRADYFRPGYSQQPGDLRVIRGGGLQGGTAPSHGRQPQNLE